MAKEYFCTYHSCLAAMEQLNNEERGRLFTALLSYSQTGEVPQLDGNERFVFPAMRDQMDRDSKKYQEKCKKNRKSIEQRYTTENDHIQSNTKPTKEKTKAKEKEKTKENIKGVPGGNPRADEPPQKVKRFTPPTVEEIRAYCRGRCYRFERIPAAFCYLLLHPIHRRFIGRTRSTGPTIASGGVRLTTQLSLILCLVFESLPLGNERYRRKGESCFCALCTGLKNAEMKRYALLKRAAMSAFCSVVKIRLALTFTQRLGMVYSSAPSGKLRERRTSAGRSGSHKCVNLFAVECKSGPFAQHFPPAGKETQPGGGFVAWDHDFRGFPTCTRVWRRGSPAGENSHQRKDRPLQLCAIHPRKGVESRRFFAELYFYRSELQFVGITARQ